VVFVAEAPLNAPDAGAREAERAVKELGACGLQIVTNVNGKPLDRPEFEPFFAAMNKLGKPVWVHPTRGANMPDYADEKKSLYEIWWTFGWSYETAAFMARMVFSKTLDKYSNLKIVVHHFGGIVPMLEGRIGPGWDVLGQRTSDEDYSQVLPSLKRPHLEYLREFYGDTAMFGGGTHALRCGLEFFGADHVVFATDTPLGPIAPTIEAVKRLDLPADQMRKLFVGNAERLLNRTFN
jgi:uncharacterized protein